MHLNRSIEQFERTARKQEAKGFKKYGQTLNPLDDYNWLKMAEEEIVDAFKYLTAEQKKREVAIEKIRKRTDDTDILFWLEELEGRND